MKNDKLADLLILSSVRYSAMGKCIDSSLLLVLVNPRQVHYGSQFGVHFSVAPHEPALSKGDLIS